MYKKRVLFITEFSGLNTGFSGISRFILNHLYNTGKYEVAEYASYVAQNDQRLGNYPWKIYSSIPDKNSPLYHEYVTDIYGQFGKTLLEYVLLDFKPDFVIDHRDQWMSSAFELKTPFRKYFKYIYMPTIDGEPQKMEWIDDYENTDILLTYTKYAKDLLKKQAPHIKVLDVVRPAVDPTVFKPIPNKKEIRDRLGIHEDANIILSVMRNQKRKLYPDLMDAFRLLLDKMAKANFRHKDNTYLYCHTSYPDVGFDLQKHILRNNISHRVLFTYVCRSCNNYYTSFFDGEISICKICKNWAAHMPNTNFGTTQEQLCEIYNIADLYVQYSICEGLCMPIAEAKSCGIPSMAVDYSAMSEQVVNIYGCWPIKPERFFYESITETEQIRALPDNNDFCEKAYNFLKIGKREREKMAENVRKDAMENYSFQRSAKIFEKVIDNSDILDRNITWNSNKPNIIEIPDKIPNIPTKNNHIFVDWCIDNILCSPELKESYFKYDILKAINSGFINNKGGQRSQFNRNECVKLFVSMAEKNNYWENIRCGKSAKKELVEII